MPLVSVILLVWNHTDDLFNCLAALQNQTFAGFDVILVDNGSCDAAYLDGLQERCPRLSMTVKKLDANLGFAAGNNIGARLAQGRWLALLNTDAFPEPSWLEALLKAADDHPHYAVFASRQIQAHAPSLLDGAGDAYHASGMAWRRFYNRPVRDYGLQAQEVFSACPAAALYSREAFLDAGGFDDDYFSYFEDVDLGFRLRLGGGKCLYVPEAVVHHVGSASTGKRSDFSVYYGYRNLIWTFVKNMPSPLFWLFLPLHVATLSFFVLYLALRGQGRVIWRAVFDALRGLPKMIRKRKMIQRNKKIKTKELPKVMSMGLLEPWREFAQRNRVK